MIRAVKEMYGGLRIYDGESWLKSKSWANVRPLFWKERGCDEVAINYRGEPPSPELIKVAEEYQKSLTDKLVGKPLKALTDWVDKEEFEDIR